MEVAASDEADHVPPSDGERGRRSWSESHRLDVFCPDVATGVSLSITKHPSPACVSFVAAVLRPGELPIVLTESEIVCPVRGWEIRASGLWADHICETSLDHWSYGLEAFALAVDDPDELLGRGLGDRVALGWELEFEARRSAVWATGSAYSQAGIAHGLLLIGTETHEIAGVALRRHRWGTDRDLTVMVPADPPRSEHGPHSYVRLPDLDAEWQMQVSDVAMSVTVTERSE